jgi:uncharacterized tellurite resistance protein B-like protein
MTRDNDIGLVKALGFVAWSDERISPEEKKLLATAMDALGIPAERRCELCESLRGAPATAAEIAASFDDDAERRFAMAQAIMMAGVDGEVSELERGRIAELAHAMGIDDAELSFIYDAVAATTDAFPFSADEGDSKADE